MRNPIGLLIFGAALAGALAPGCNCSDATKGIPCTGQATNECPVPTTCDVAKGFCVDARNDAGMIYTCRPPLPGCACESSDAPITCLPQGTDPNVVASCKEGKSFCIDGTYNMCQGIANQNCTTLTVGPGQFKPTPTNSENVKLGTDGELLLTPSMKKVDFGYLWIANTGENTVSKIDVDSGDEVARYASVRNSAMLGVDPVPVGGFPGTAAQDNCGNCPSRTAIDFNGDAFVANRAFGEQGTVTKFANEKTECVDRNMNGKIDTSVDLNGNKRIDVTDPTEFFAEADECILWTAKVGNAGGIPRALAIDAGGPDGENGNVWVGLYAENRAIQISGDTGMPIQFGGGPVSVSLVMGGSTVAPYGAAIDGAGFVWLTALSGGGPGGDTVLAKVNSVTRTLERVYVVPDDKDGISNTYGISVDNKGRVWLGGYGAKDAKVFIPATETFHRRDFEDAEVGTTGNQTTTRGIAIDLAGDVWVAFTGGRVGRVNGDAVVAMGSAAPAMIYTLPAPAATPTVTMTNTIGVGVDRNGNVWAVSRNDAAPSGAITRIMPAAGLMESFLVGKAPYTYSDFTGFGLLTVVRPSGFFRSVVEGCLDNTNKTKWRALTWTESEPAGTNVKLRVRFADTIPALDTANWFGPFDTPQPAVDLVALMVPSTRYAQVEVQLSSTDPALSPVFSGYNLSFDGCGIAIGDNRVIKSKRSTSSPPKSQSKRSRGAPQSQPPRT